MTRGIVHHLAGGACLDCGDTAEYLEQTAATFDRDSICDGQAVTAGSLRVGDLVRVGEGKIARRVTGTSGDGTRVWSRSLNTGHSQVNTVDQLVFDTTSPWTRAMLEVESPVEGDRADVRHGLQMVLNECPVRYMMLNETWTWKSLTVIVDVRAACESDLQMVVTALRNAGAEVTDR